MHNYFSKIIFGILLTAVFLSCDLLTTRNAEDPDAGRTSNPPATTVEQLFKNLKNSFFEKNSKDYIICFVDSSFLNLPFKFSASPEAIYKYNSLSEWSLESEDTYFKNLVNILSTNNNVILTLELITNSVQGNIETRSYNYKLELPFIDEGTNLIYEGNGLFTAVLDENNQWVITEWIDTKTGENPTWSELKGRFYFF
jgi:hypothetical protein